MVSATEERAARASRLSVAKQAALKKDRKRADKKGLDTPRCEPLPDIEIVRHLESVFAPHTGACFPQCLPPPREARHHGAGRNSNDLRDLLVRELF